MNSHSCLNWSNISEHIKCVHLSFSFEKWDKFVEENPMNIESDSKRQPESISFSPFLLTKNALNTDLCAEQKIKYYRSFHIAMKSTLSEKLTIKSYVQFNDVVRFSCRFIQTALPLRFFYLRLDFRILSKRISVIFHLFVDISSQNSHS